MKFNDIAPQEQTPWQCSECGRPLTQCACQLDEGLRELVAAAIMGAAAVAPTKMVDHLPPKPTAVDAAKWKAHIAQKEALTVTAALKQKYRAIPDKDLVQIFALAKKYERPVFPKAADILAIVGIESSYNKLATSNLKKDPAKGLMQVRPGVWGIDAKALATIEDQIKFGSEVLFKYYTRLGDQDDAVHAYNVGITNFKRGTGLNPAYVEKFHRERKWLKQVWQKVAT